MTMSRSLEEKHEPGRASEGLDELCINTIRTLSIDAAQKANSGRPGMPMAASTAVGS
jgi:transketolase